MVEERSMAEEQMISKIKEKYGNELVYEVRKEIESIIGDERKKESVLWIVSDKDIKKLLKYKKLEIIDINTEKMQSIVLWTYDFDKDIKKFRTPNLSDFLHFSLDYMREILNHNTLYLLQEGLNELRGEWFYIKKDNNKINIQASYNWGEWEEREDFPSPIKETVRGNEIEYLYKITVNVTSKYKNKERKNYNEWYLTQEEFRDRIRGDIYGGEIKKDINIKELYIKMDKDIDLSKDFTEKDVLLFHLCSIMYNNVFFLIRSGADKIETDWYKIEKQERTITATAYYEWDKEPEIFKNFTVEEVVNQLKLWGVEITPRTIKHYKFKRMIPYEKTPGEKRIYSIRQIGRLLRIDEMKREGKTLEEIAKIFNPGQ